MNTIQIAIAQINSTVGAIDANCQKIAENINKARRQNADIIVFPELAITGYPPQDLIYEPGFIEKNQQALERLLPIVSDFAALAGFIYRDEKEMLYNAVALIHKQKIKAIIKKQLLPTYDVFDERRYFEPGENQAPVKVEIGGRAIRLGIEICEDLWDKNYERKVSQNLAKQGAELIINCSASPFSNGKAALRRKLVQEKISAYSIPFVYANMVGGQDELIFDGNSFAYNDKNELIHISPGFKEALNVFTIGNKPCAEPQSNPMEEMYQALVLGIRDYFSKNGFSEAVLGLSGGIDSALVAVLAAEALGPKQLYGYSLPSQYSSNHSLSDAEILAKNLAIHYDVIAIEPLYQAFSKALEKQFAGTAFGIAEENIQSRVRGTILMSIANKFNRLALTTGNKTELAQGYCTLYGDMAGGLAPISDLNKTEVYALSRYINQRSGKEIIPKGSLEKEPSAELRDNQVDPFDYPVVSPLVETMLEQRKSHEELFAAGYDKELIKRTSRLMRLAEHKRRQAPPGLRVSENAFGSGRRMPIVNHYSE
ncbi:MAG TPA: NAD+ synthase [Candidatus Marinimicrobia bacterium]|nr:NAD+ synthase [Candidatus Neomarinimicrobiota bacterium]